MLYLGVTSTETKQGRFLREFLTAWEDFVFLLPHLHERNVHDKMEGWESLYYLWVGMLSCVSLASRTQTQTPPRSTLGLTRGGFISHYIFRW